ncbi:uncharacterized protein J3D65DRAFT_604730 [Phyllosticta citribraziliensis]|uniref:Uncharacterized protein n=1 Tax=Phyllosticta citribraziliensis TaxID=989973 RepID=A0ABR1LJH4_9PEZI
MELQYNNPPIHPASLSPATQSTPLVPPPHDPHDEGDNGAGLSSHFLNLGEQGLGMEDGEMAREDDAFGASEERLNIVRSWTTSFQITQRRSRATSLLLRLKTCHFRVKLSSAKESQAETQCSAPQSGPSSNSGSNNANNNLPPPSSPTLCSKTEEEEDCPLNAIEQYYRALAVETEHVMANVDVREVVNRLVEISPSLADTAESKARDMGYRHEFVMRHGHSVHHVSWNLTEEDVYRREREGRPHDWIPKEQRAEKDIVLSRQKPSEQSPAQKSSVESPDDPAADLHVSPAQPGRERSENLPQSEEIQDENDKAPAEQAEDVSPKAPSLERVKDNEDGAEVRLSKKTFDALKTRNLSAATQGKPGAIPKGLTKLLKLLREKTKNTVEQESGTGKILRGQDFQKGLLHQPHTEFVIKLGNGKTCAASKHHFTKRGDIAASSESQHCSNPGLGSDEDLWEYSDNTQGKKSCTSQANPDFYATEGKTQRSGPRKSKRGRAHDGRHAEQDDIEEVLQSTKGVDDLSDLTDHCRNLAIYHSSDEGKATAKDFGVPRMSKGVAGVDKAAAGCV